MDDKADRAGKSRRVERIVLRTVEVLADRILKGVDAEGRNMFTKRPEDITDDDRIAALQAFLENLRETNPVGYAAIQAALSDALARAQRRPRAPRAHRPARRPCRLNRIAPCPYSAPSRGARRPRSSRRSRRISRRRGGPTRATAAVRSLSIQGRPPALWRRGGRRQDRPAARPRADGARALGDLPPRLWGPERDRAAADRRSCGSREGYNGTDMALQPRRAA